MHVTLQSSGRSPRQISGSSMKSQLKPVSDSMQNNTTFPPQSKGKKREREDLGFEPAKRDRTSRIDDIDSGHSRFENILKPEITKITDNGGLVDIECVKKLVQLIQQESYDKKIDFAGRSLLIGVIAATDNIQCLSEFVQLRGLPVLDEWLQEAHKGKTDDVARSRDSDKSVEDFLLVLLRALDRLPVNLNALQMCNIGKSVNHLRTYKNGEIQKKARSLVDTWKKRVEAEMNNDDAKPSSGQAVVSWPARSRQADISHVGSRLSSASSENALRSSIIQPCRSSSVKLLQGETVKSASLGSKFLSAPAAMNLKEAQPRVAFGCNISDHPLVVSKDEKSSCCSISGSANGRKLPEGTSRHRRSATNLPGSLSGVQREAASGRTGSLKSSAEKVLQSATTCEKPIGLPISDGNFQKFIVKLPNQDCSPVRSVSRGSLDDFCIEKQEEFGQDSKEKSDACHANINTDENTESWQSNDLKDVVSGSDEGSESPDGVGRLRRVEDVGKVSVETKTSAPFEEDIHRLAKMSESSFGPLSSLVENHILPVDDVGMRLLASVATGEIPKSENVSDSGHKRLRDEDSCSVDGFKTEQKEKDEFHLEQDHRFDHSYMDVEKHCITFDRPQSNNDGLSHPPSANISGVCKTITLEDRLDTHIETVASSNAQLPEPVGSYPELHSNFDGSCSEQKVSGGEEGLQYHEKKSVDEAGIDGNNVETSESSDEKQVRSIYVTAGDNGNIYGSDKAERVPSSHFVLETVDKTGEIKEGRDTSQAAIPEEPVANMCSMYIVKHEEVPPSSDTDMNFGQDYTEEIKVGLDVEMSSGHPSFLEDKSRCEQLKTFPNLQSPDVVNSVENKDITGQHLDDLIYKEEQQLRYPSKMVELGECTSTVADAPTLSVARDLGIDERVKFDLNEGLSADDGKYLESINLVPLGCSSSSNLINSLPLPFSLPYTGIHPSVTVAAAAKGPFVHPETLLRSKGELGWKGSAATSAFRPAEPRKVLGMHMNMNSLPHSDSNAEKQDRSPLEIDLNIPDERILEDMTCKHFNEQSGSKFTSLNVLAHGCTHGRPSGGIIFDLNSVDETMDFGQYSTSNALRIEPLPLPIKPSSSSGYLKYETNCRNEIDLNNGPRVEETTLEPALLSQLTRSGIKSQSTIASLKMSNAEICNYLSIPSGTPTYSTVAHPALLSDRGEHSLPLVRSGPPRMLTPHGNLPFPPNPLQYPIFPFGTSFPIPAATFSVASTGYIDSSGGNFCFPGVHSPVLARSVPSQFPKAYGMGATESCSTSAEVVNMKWSRQGLDLNAGPGIHETEIKDETGPLNLRHLSSNAPQFLVEEQTRMYKGTGSALKSETEVLWEGDRFNYRPSSWQ